MFTLHCTTWGKHENDAWVVVLSVDNWHHRWRYRWIAPQGLYRFISIAFPWDYFKPNEESIFSMVNWKLETIVKEGEEKRQFIAESPKAESDLLSKYIRRNGPTQSIVSIHICTMTFEALDSKLCKGRSWKKLKNWSFLSSLATPPSAPVIPFPLVFV